MFISALVRDNRIRVFERTTTGGGTHELPGANNGAPEWLRIVRTGNSFDLYRSNDGSSWTLMQTRTVVMGSNVYIGTAVTGNSTTTLATGVFDNVSVTGGGGATATPTATNTVTSTATQTTTATATSSGATPTATATQSPTLWANADIGSVGVAGSATIDKLLLANGSRVRGDICGNGRGRNRQSKKVGLAIYFPPMTNPQHKNE